MHFSLSYMEYSRCTVDESMINDSVVDGEYLLSWEIPSTW